MSTDAKQYRIWQGLCAFRKDGSPVAGTMGSTHRSVVVMHVDTFKRMLDEHPTLKADDVVYEMGEL